MCKRRCLSWDRRKGCQILQVLDAFVRHDSFAWHGPFVVLQGLIQIYARRIHIGTHWFVCMTTCSHEDSFICMQYVFVWGLVHVYARLIHMRTQLYVCMTYSYEWPDFIQASARLCALTLCIYMWIHICKYEYICTHVYIYMYMHMYICSVGVCDIYIYVHIYTYIYTYTNVCKYVYKCLYKYIYVLIYTYIHISTYIYIHMYIYIYECIYIMCVCVHIRKLIYIFYTYYMYTYTHIHIYIWYTNLLYSLLQDQVAAAASLRALHCFLTARRLFIFWGTHPPSFCFLGQQIM